MGKFHPEGIEHFTGSAIPEVIGSPKRYVARCTPIIASTSDIDNLLSRGYITVTTRPNNDPQRYAICPVIKDPTDGGIARDQFLAITVKADGTPVEPSFLENFESLRTTGDWAD